MTTVPREARLVAYGARRSALLRLDLPLAAHVVQWAADHRLAARTSTWAWRLEQQAELGGYANLMRRVPVRDACSDDVVSVAVAPDPADAADLLMAEDDDDDRAVGHLLGYPECCTEAFAARWPRARQERGGDLAQDLVEEGGSGPHPYTTNVLARYLGASLVEHFPCRSRCAGSLHLGRRHEAALDRFEPSAAARLRSLLQAPLVWSPTGGVAVLHGSRVHRNDDGWQVRVDQSGLLATVPWTGLARALRATTTLCCSTDGVLALDPEGPARLVLFAEEDSCATCSSPS